MILLFCSEIQKILYYNIKTLLYICIWIKVFMMGVWYYLYIYAGTDPTQACVVETKAHLIITVLVYQFNHNLQRRRVLVQSFIYKDFYMSTITVRCQYSVYLWLSIARVEEVNDIFAWKVNRGFKSFLYLMKTPTVRPSFCRSTREASSSSPLSTHNVRKRYTYEGIHLKPKRLTIPWTYGRLAF